MMNSSEHKCTHLDSANNANNNVRAERENEQGSKGQQPHTSTRDMPTVCVCSCLALAVQIPGKNETDRNAHHLLFRRERKKVKKNKRIKENDGKKSRRRNKENREGLLPELLDWGAPDQKKCPYFWMSSSSNSFRLFLSEMP